MHSKEIHELFILFSDQSIFIIIASKELKMDKKV
jgi:hypothetical protein